MKPYQKARLEPKNGGRVNTPVSKGRKKVEPASREVKLPELNIQKFQFTIVGDSPLICKAWSQKAKAMMLAKQMKEPTEEKGAKDPWRDFVDSLYWLTPKPEKPTQKDIEEAEFGFPSVGFKSAAVDACSFIDGVTKVQARGSFHVQGEYVKIDGDSPAIREDMVKIAMGTADIRHRAEFKKWSATIQVRYNKNAMSAEQILNLFRVAGFAIGIGEWRPSRDGSFGMFSLA